MVWQPILNVADRSARGGAIVIAYAVASGGQS